jgi:hypothetical protein
MRPIDMQPWRYRMNSVILYLMGGWRMGQPPAHAQDRYESTVLALPVSGHGKHKEYQWVTIYRLSDSALNDVLGPSRQ